MLELEDPPVLPLLSGGPVTTGVEPELPGVPVPGELDPGVLLLFPVELEGLPVTTLPPEGVPVEGEPEPFTGEPEVGELLPQV